MNWGKDAKEIRRNKSTRKSLPFLASLCVTSFAPVVFQIFGEKGWEQFLFYFQFCSSRRSVRKIAATISDWSKTRSATDVSESLWQAVEHLAIELRSIEHQLIWDRSFRVQFSKALKKLERKEREMEKKNSWCVCSCRLTWKSSRCKIEKVVVVYEEQLTSQRKKY